jgi:hypothetical protein
LVRLSATARKVGVGTGTVQRINRDVPPFWALTLIGLETRFFANNLIVTHPWDIIFKSRAAVAKCLGRVLRNAPRDKLTVWTKIAAARAAK